MTDEETQKPADENDNPEGTHPQKDPNDMNEEELRDQLEKHFREQKVDEVLVQFMVSLSNLAYIKMGLTEETEKIKDLDQASLAIDAFKGLLDAAGKKFPEQEASALAGALSSMQITFVKVSGPQAGDTGSGAANAGQEEKSAAGEKPAAGDQPPTSDKPAAEADKPANDPASRLWVPGKE